MPPTRSPVPLRQPLPQIQLIHRREALLEAYRDAVVVRRRRVEDTTWRSYRVCLRAFFDFLADDGARDPAEATAADYDAFLRRKIRRGRNAGRPLGPRTQHTYAVILTGFYDWAYAAGWFEHNPLAGVQVPALPPPNPRTVPAKGIKRLFAYIARAGDLRLLVMAMLAYGMGLRVREIALARIEDVVLGDTPTITVVRKGGREQTLPLHPAVADVLEAHIDRATCGPLVEDLRRPGEHITAARVSRLLSLTLAAAGVRGTGHWLRHAFATELLRAGRGRNLHAVSHLLNHKNTSVTEEIYTNTYHDDAWQDIHLLQVPKVALPRRRDRPPNRRATKARPVQPRRMPIPQGPIAAPDPRELTSPDTIPDPSGPAPARPARRRRPG